ncbi:hypothetical protein ABVK25_008342 [Lepraria finkii]|uniref:Uncharacterized protein n=1 Tax=Lepraria finkii TaxID=1340010 RepID=A0ABR4B071_9LECA
MRPCWASGGSRAISGGELGDVRFLVADAEACPAGPLRRPRIHRLRAAQRHRQGRGCAARSTPGGLRPGGRFACLEFSRVQVAALAPLYDAWSFGVLPRLGAAIAGDADSYRYLAESIRTFPDLGERCWRCMMRQYAPLGEWAGCRPSHRNLTWASRTPPHPTHGRRRLRRPRPADRRSRRDRRSRALVLLLHGPVLRAASRGRPGRGPGGAHLFRHPASLQALTDEPTAWPSSALSRAADLAGGRRRPRRPSWPSHGNRRRAPDHLATTLLLATDKPVLIGHAGDEPVAHGGSIRRGRQRRHAAASGGTSSDRRTRGVMACHEFGPGRLGPNPAILHRLQHPSHARPTSPGAAAMPAGACCGDQRPHARAGSIRCTPSPPACGRPAAPRRARSAGRGAAAAGRAGDAGHRTGRADPPPPHVPRCTRGRQTAADGCRLRRPPLPADVAVLRGRRWATGGWRAPAAVTTSCKKQPGAAHPLHWTAPRTSLATLAASGRRPPAPGGWPPPTHETGKWQTNAANAAALLARLEPARDWREHGLRANASAPATGIMAGTANLGPRYCHPPRRRGRAAGDGRSLPQNRGRRPARRPIDRPAPPTRGRCQEMVVGRLPRRGAPPHECLPAPPEAPWPWPFASTPAWATLLNIMPASRPGADPPPGFAILWPTWPPLGGAGIAAAPGLGTAGSRR